MFIRVTQNFKAKPAVEFYSTRGCIQMQAFYGYLHMQSRCFHQSIPHQGEAYATLLKLLIYAKHDEPYDGNLFR